MRDQRIGVRQKRGRRETARIPDLGYYIIITDTEETEACFFRGLRQHLPRELQDRLVIKVERTSTSHLLEQAEEVSAYEAQYRKPWIVFDRDEVPMFDQIISDAAKRGIHVGWSNPCFEIWLYAYFGQMPVVGESTKCCRDFGAEFRNRVKRMYKKADPHLYESLLEKGDEERAIAVAASKIEQHKRNGKEKPTEMCPATMVHVLVQEIREKTKGRGGT